MFHEDESNDFILAMFSTVALSTLVVDSGVIAAMFPV